jgi:hypothetical protein
VRDDVGIDAQTCKCGLRSPIRTLWMTTNLDKRFFRCAMYDSSNVN